MEWWYVELGTTIETLLEKAPMHQKMFAVCNSECIYQGYILRTDIDGYSDAKTAGELLHYVSKFSNRRIKVYSRDPLDLAYKLLKEHQLQFIPVVDYTNYLEGSIDR